jgi:hypothetical protein
LKEIISTSEPLLYYIEAEALARQGREAEARQILFDITSKEIKTTYYHQNQALS